MVSRRKLLAGILGIGTIGAGAGGYSILRQPETVFAPDAHRGEVVEHTLTLDQRSYLNIEDPRYVEMETGFSIYQEGSPEESLVIHSTSVVGRSGGWELTLDPGTYHIVAVNIPPSIAATKYHYFRDTNDVEPVSVSEYLDAISVSTETTDESQLYSTRSIATIDEYHDDQVIGADPEEQIVKVGRSDEPKQLAKSLDAAELLIRPQVDRVGGGMKQRYEEIRRENDRVIPTIYVLKALPKLYQNSGPLTESYVGLLTALLDNQELASAISDAQSGAGPSTGVRAYWSLKPARFVDETTAAVPVGLGFSVDHTEIPGMERSASVYSPRVNVRATREQPSSKVWTVGSDLVRQVLGDIKGLISG